MRHALLPAALLALVACSHPEEERAAPALGCDVEGVRRAISAPHDVPTPSELERACPEPAPALIELAEDPSRRGLTRLRAVGLLGGFSDEPSVRALERLALAPSSLASVRRSAAEALGRATQPGDARRERVGRAALLDPDPHVRRAGQELLKR